MKKFSLNWSRTDKPNGSEIVDAVDQEAATQMALARLRRDSGFGYYKATPHVTV
jgi:hypothetical protein